MSTQKVTDKILADAKKEAKEILDNYKKEAAKIKKKYGEKIAAKRTQIETEAEVVKKTEILRTVSQKRLELSRKTVSQKQKFIKDTIKQALNTLPEHEKYLDFLKALIKKSEEKEGELVIYKQDWKRYGPDLEKFMKKQKIDFKVSASDEIIGGVMVKKGKITYHGSLDLISELLSDELTIAVSKTSY